MNSNRDITAKDGARVQVGSNYTTIHKHAADTHFADREKAKLRTDFLRGLNTSPYLERKDRNPERANGTCEWFTKHRLFEKWKAEAAAILWVSADPGCGKSVLAKHLVDDVFPSSNSRITCYFFFKDDFEDQKSLEGALCCILHQLFTQQPNLLSDSVLGEFEEEGDVLFSSFSKLWKLLMKVVNSHSEREIICILDALDECVGYKVLARTLAQHFGKDNGNSRLKFLVTSRPYIQIQHEFHDLKASQPTIHLSGESQEEVDSIAREITIAIQHRIEDLGRKRELSIQEKQILHDELTAVTHRTYLWVHLVFAVLDEVDVLSHDDWCANIRKLPHTVEEAYSRILSKSTDPERTRNILQIIVAAERPLRLTEMAEVLAFRVKRHTKYADIRQNMQTGDRLQVEIRQVCGLFVVVQHEEIFLLHQTAREFLVCLSPMQPKTLHSPSSWRHSVDLRVSHSLLAEICIRYMHLTDFQSPGSARTWHERKNQIGLFFFEYAAEHWADHYREAQSITETDLENLALKLCDAESFDGPPGWLDVYAKSGRQEGGLVHGLRTPLLIASYFGLHNLVNLILKKDKKSLNATDYSRRTALSLASERGYELVTQSLLDRVSKAKVILKDKWLSSSSPTIVNRPDNHGKSPLRYAAERGHQEIVKQLLEKGAKVDQIDKDGRIPLFWATIFSHTEIVNLLLEAGSQQGSASTSLEMKDQWGQTFLLLASDNGDERLVRLLLDRGADINASANDGGTALIAASRHSYDAIVKLLLDRGADVNASKNDGGTALIAASFNGDEHLVRLLLDRGADVNASENDGGTALIAASDNGDERLVRLLLDRGADVNASENDGGTALIAASLNGYDAIVKLLLDRRADINVSENNGVTALIAASLYGHDAIVKLLLDKGADVNASKNNGDTALIYASFNGYSAVVKILLDRGADVNASKNDGGTALIAASFYSYDVIVNLLLDRGADVNASENDGGTALIAASSRGNDAIVNLLLDGGADVNASDSEGNTALSLALKKHEHAVAKLLREKGAKEVAEAS